MTLIGHFLLSKINISIGFNMKKKNFILPQAEIVLYENKDIILTSAEVEEYADDDWSTNDGVENW